MKFLEWFKEIGFAYGLFIGVIIFDLWVVFK